MHKVRITVLKKEFYPDLAQESAPGSERQDSPSLGKDASGGVKNAPSALNKVKPDADTRPLRPGYAGLQD